MNSRGAAIKIALLDASRRNPFERRFRRYSAGLAAAVTPTDTLVLYSAAVGSVVSNSRNDHSLFVTELLEEIRTPSVSAEQALRNTQAGVSSATNREQVPWLSSSLTSEFSFSGGPIRPFDNGIGQSQSEAETGKPVCELPKPLDPPAADDMANNPRVKEMSSRIAADRNDRIAYYKRGQVYTNKRAYALAVQNFGNAIRLDATDAEAYNNRCWTRAVLGDLQAALKDCDKALQLDPGLAVALDSRGMVNLKLGKYAAAIRDYSQSIEKNPRSVSSLFGRGVAKRRSGGDVTTDLALAKSMDPKIVGEFAGYGVTECAQ
jgi:tetratricopeptide (TPR) repeat protein